jgi:hypothetical protein
MVEIEVYCSCGEGLCRQTKSGETRGRVQPFFEVSPCEKCLEKAREEGQDAGYEEGQDAGYKEGQSAGYKEGGDFATKESCNL